MAVVAVFYLDCGRESGYQASYSTFQRLCRTSLRTFLAKDTLRSVLTTARIIVHLDIHWAYPQAFPTTIAFLLVAPDAKEGIIAHRLQKHRYRTNVLAKGAIVLEHDGEDYAYNIIYNVSRNKYHEHRIGICHAEPEKKQYDSQREGERDIANEAPFLSWRFRLLVRQQVKNHCRPTGKAAPSPTKQQGAEYLGNGIMKRASPKNAIEQVVPKALNLHILATHQAKKHKHIGADAKLSELPCILPACREKEHAQSDTNTNIRKI